MTNELSGQITFNTNFENGRLDTAYVDSTSYTLWPITNLHFRLTNAVNQTPDFQIFDPLGYQLRFYHHMVYRYEGDVISIGISSIQPGIPLKALMAILLKG